MLLAWLVGTAVAEACPPPEVLVVAGGVSQGAYQAGQMHVLAEWLRAKPDEPGCAPGLVLAGASAGALNSLILTAELARNGHRTGGAPEASLFWRAWVPAGLDHSPTSILPGPEDGEDIWILDPTAAVEGLRALDSASRPLPGDSPWPGTVAIGFPLTRLAPLDVGAVPRVTEAVAWTWQASAGAPFQSRKHDGTTGDSYAWDAVGEAAMASAAVPVGIAPRRPFDCAALHDVAFWYLPGSDVPLCAAGDAPDFVDGGFYDNNPVALATALADATFADRPARTLTYLDPNLRPKGARPLPADRTDQVVAAAQLLGVFRDQNTATWAVQNAADWQIQPVLVGTTPASTNLGAFFGFYDRTIRAADFYQGMHDAWIALERRGESPDVAWLGPEAGMARWVHGQVGSPDADADALRAALASPEAACPRLRGATAGEAAVFSCLADRWYTPPQGSVRVLVAEDQPLGRVAADPWPEDTEADARANLGVLIALSRVQSAAAWLSAQGADLRPPGARWYFDELDRPIAGEVRFVPRDLPVGNADWPASARVRASSHLLLRRALDPRYGLVETAAFGDQREDALQAGLVRGVARTTLRAAMGHPTAGYVLVAGRPAGPVVGGQLGVGVQGALFPFATVHDHLAARALVEWGALGRYDEVPAFVGASARVGAGVTWQRGAASPLWGPPLAVSVDPVGVVLEAKRPGGGAATWAPEVSVSISGFAWLGASVDVYSAATGDIRDQALGERLQITGGLRAF